jgi:hypothetical protein
MIFLLSILYVIIGVAVAFFTAMTMGMSDINPKSYLGFVYKTGKSKIGLAFVLLAIVATWPAHIPLTFLSH